MVDGRTTRGGAGHLGLTQGGKTARQVVDGLRTEVCGHQKQSNDPRNNQHNPNTPTTGPSRRSVCAGWYFWGYVCARLLRREWGAWWSTR